MLRLYTHPACLQHDPGPGHVERPARLRAVLQALDHDRYAALDRIEAPQATREQLWRVHGAAHVGEILLGAPPDDMLALDPDTVMGPGSTEAALRAAGAVVAAVDAVLGGEVRRAFCAVRPPGHHATRERAMGFCLLNNVAVGAAHALAAHGLKRVAIADFDVHHGNGTQEIFEREPRVLFASSHQSPLYPDSGSEDERGVGNIANGTLSPGAGSYEFRELWDGVLLPRLHAFKPQLVLVSAGFDAHRDDPLADLRLGPDDYAWITERLVALAHAHAGGRLVSSLEGGYNLAALAACASAHVAALMD
ncbi:acetoin utilization protein [Rhodanobacter sp. FW510-R12]|uniref:histone deacetylase family protein n=1 Tax=unclassified Rhodanobacter TaxID=2621553 RepID=UPI0007AA156F|nr:MULTISPECIES: histone deacetylase family protein [unclassified Rhodanobacter]KZC17260.1 acetoin utilization protein [Rhodanobacter sp. FW104-R8]KZC29116.1 acetoin utilization protein [Rhodanobacter sp. FW510-T8]KZC33054.1 acetoin utilization protein [Rhodanobacter sp. FW510-R10]